MQLKNITSIGIADIIGSGITGVFWFYLATLLEPESYGEIHYIIAIAGIASYICLVGTQNTLTVYVAKNIPIQSTLNFISLILGILCFIILSLFLDMTSGALLVFGYIMSNLAIGLILGKRKYNVYMKYVLLQKFLTPVLGLGLYFTLGVEGVIYGLALTYIGYSFIIFKEFKITKIDFTLLRTRKKFILYNYLYMLTGPAHSHIDKIIIMPILGAAILGNYALTLQIISFMMIFSQVFYKYFLPQESAGYNIEKTKKMLIIISILMTIVGYFLVPLILPTVFPKYEESVEAIKIMSLSLIPMSIVTIYTSKFFALEKSKIVLIGLTISVGILIPSMLILGRLYEINGVAAAFVIATVFQAGYFYYTNRKMNNMNKQNTDNL